MTTHYGIWWSGGDRHTTTGRVTEADLLEVELIERRGDRIKIRRHGRTKWIPADRLVSWED